MKDKRLKFAKKLKGQWLWKNLDKGMIKEYDLQIKPKKENDKKHPGVFNDGCNEYDVKDMEKFKGAFIDRKTTVKKWKPVVASIESWVDQFFDGFIVCSDIILYWMNMIYSENAQPNVAKMFMPLWMKIVEGFIEKPMIMDDIEGKLITALLCEKAFSTKQVVDLCHEVLSKQEQVMHPGVCLRVYMATIDKTKSNLAGLNCMKRIKLCIQEYGLGLIKSVKTPSKPFKDPKDFCKQFIKLWLKLKDKKTKQEGEDVVSYCYQILGEKHFWKECKFAGSELQTWQERLEDVTPFKKGKYPKGEGEWIGAVIKRKKREAKKEAARIAAGLGGPGVGGVDGAGGGIDGMLGGIPQAPLGPLPGLVAQNFTPLMFTPQQLLALKYGPAPHAWQMNNFRHYVDRLPAAFCMDWEEFENKKTTVTTKAVAPYVKIGDVRIDVETGKQFQDLTTADGKIKIFASMPPEQYKNQNFVGDVNDPNTSARYEEEKKFMNDAKKDDEIMTDILGVEKDNAEYFDEHNDGSSWLALYDVNGFDETDRQIQLIEMRNIYGVKTLQTWLHSGKNVSIVESSVNKLLAVLLPWLRDLINTETLMSDAKRYEHTYQILQLLKFCCKFKTLKSLNKSDLTSFFQILLSSITYDNINALYGHHYKRILGEINDVLIKSIINTEPKDTLCILISLLSECEPTNDSLSKQQYAEACCKLIYKVLKRYDRVICQYSEKVQDIYVEIVKFFSAISFETWQMAEPKRRFPLKVIQMIIARIVFFMGNTSAQHLEAAIESLQKNNKNMEDNYVAHHQRDVYAKRLIMNFINCCENRRLQSKNPNNLEKMNMNNKYQEFDKYEENKPLNIKQAQSSLSSNNQNNNFMKPTKEAPSTLQSVHELETKAARYARENKIDLNFALWVGMTGKNKNSYVNQY